MIRTVLALCAAFLAVSAAAGAAETLYGPAPGYRYAVTGVAGNDTLNVRSDAGADAPVVGVLSPSAGGLIVSGNWQRIDDSAWWEIAFRTPEGASGWVNARFLTEDPDSTVEETGYPLTCQGTEPFWGLTIDGSVATTDDYALGAQSFVASDWQAARGLRGWFAVFLASNAPGNAGQSVVTVTQELCSDGMSDRDYPFFATLALANREVYGGCCYRTLP